MKIIKHGKRFTITRAIYLVFSVLIFLLALLTSVAAIVALTTRVPSKYFTISPQIDKYLLCFISIVAFFIFFYLFKKCLTFLSFTESYIQETILWARKPKNFSNVNQIIYSPDESRPVLQFFSNKKLILVLDSAYHGYDFTLTLVNFLIEKYGDKIKFTNLNSYIEERTQDTSTGEMV